MKKEIGLILLGGGLLPLLVGCGSPGKPAGTSHSENLQTAQYTHTKETRARGKQPGSSTARAAPESKRSVSRTAAETRLPEKTKKPKESFYPSAQTGTLREKVCVPGGEEETPDFPPEEAPDAWKESGFVPEPEEAQESEETEPFFDEDLNEEETEEEIPETTAYEEESSEPGPPLPFLTGNSGMLFLFSEYGGDEAAMAAANSWSTEQVSNPDSPWFHAKGWTMWTVEDAEGRPVAWTVNFY